jgi:hypothetical protein
VLAISAMRSACWSGEPNILCHRLTPMLGAGLGAGSGSGTGAGRSGSSRSCRGGVSRTRRRESSRSRRGDSCRLRRGGRAGRSPDSRVSAGSADSAVSERRGGR